MVKVALLLVMCFLADTMCILLTPNQCSEQECAQGTCVQAGDSVIHECGSIDEFGILSTVFWPTRLYRILRDDENPSLGLSAKDPTANKTIQSHVGCGSKLTYRSQFISTTADLEAALDLLSLFTTSREAQHRISVINVDCLMRLGIQMENLINPTREDLPGIMAFNFAKCYHEVLVVGQIPANCIEATNFHSVTPRKDRCKKIS